MADQLAKAIRNRRIIRDRQEGMSLRTIASIYGLTAERISQIVEEGDLGVVRRRYGGNNKRVKWDAPSPPRLPWRVEIAERLRELQRTNSQAGRS